MTLGFLMRNRATEHASSPRFLTAGCIKKRDENPSNSHRADVRQLESIDIECPRQRVAATQRLRALAAGRCVIERRVQGRQLDGKSLPAWH